MAHHNAHTDILSDQPDPDPGSLWLVGIVGSVLVGVVVLGIIALFNSAMRETENENFVNLAYTSVDDARAAQESLLTADPHWVTIPAIEEGQPDRREFVIPINEAMQQIVEEYGQ